MVGAGDFGALGVVGDVEVRQKGGVEAFVAAVPGGFDEGLVEVHEDATLVHLDHTVLEAALDAQFIPLRLQAERGGVFERNLDAVELLKRLEHGRADGGGAGEPHKARDVRGVANREVARGKGDAPFAAPEEEELRDGLHEPDAAVVAEELDVAQKVVRRGEGRIVHVAGDEAELGCLVHDDFGGEVLERERNGLAEVAVGGVAEETGAGEGSGFDEHVGL